MTYQQQPAAQPLTPENERLYSTLIHVGGIVFGFIPSLVGFLVFRDRSAFVTDNSRSALNFQITWVAVQFANFLVGIPLVLITAGLWSFLELLIAVAAFAVVVVFSILAAVASNRGQIYRYPLSLSLVK